MILIERTCPFCGMWYAMWVDATEYDDWEHGMPAQEAFPTMSAMEREFIISGICEDCWEKMAEGED